MCLVLSLQASSGGCPRAFRPGFVLVEINYGGMKFLLSHEHTHIHTHPPTPPHSRNPLSSPLVQAAVKKWCDDSSVDLVLTSGGTGFGRRDLTPEAIRPLLHRSGWCHGVVARKATAALLFYWDVKVTAVRLPSLRVFVSSRLVFFSAGHQQ